MANSASYRTVALLMTDIEGSTRLWEQSPEAMLEAMRRHDDLAQRTAATHHGYVPRGRGEGDSELFVFPSAVDALRAAADFTVGLARLGDEMGMVLRVRCGVHAGDVLDADEDLYGIALNRCARIRSLARGGQILVSAVGHGLWRKACADDLAFKCLGRVTLKDLLEPEDLYQLLRPDLDSDFPPPASLDRTPNNLPVQLTPFVGRTAEIRAVAETILSHRQVTLHGPGGIGKTRLALQVATELLDAAPDGVWFVDLAPVEHDRDVLRTTMQASRSSAADESAFLGELAASSALFIFDNCEQVAESARALCERMLSQAKNLRILVTSRRRLGLHGERIHPLAGLPVPQEASDGAEPLMEAEAVQLLIDRARQNDPSFSATGENAAAVRVIVRRLDGLPLAIELAAARLRILSPAQLAERLNDIFGALGAGSVDALPRHRTIEASIEWSFSNLEPDEASLFLTLAHFVSGWTLDAAMAVHAALGLPSDPVDLLDSLSGKSMIVTGTRGGGRMRMLVPMREFALRKSAPKEPPEEAFLRWAATASNAAHSSADRGLAFAQSEADNLQSALDRALANHQFPDVYSICRVMYHGWYLSGQLAVGQTYLSAALDLAMQPAAAGAARIDQIADLHDRHGVLAWARGELDLAETSVREAGRLWSESGDEETTGRAHSHLGLILYRKGRPDEARAELEMAYHAMLSQGDPIEIAKAATNLGNLYHELGKDAEATSYFEEALALSRRHNDRRTLRTVTHLLAEVALRREDQVRARELLVESFEVAIGLQDVIGAADLMIPAAELLRQCGEYEAAAMALGALNAILGATGQVLEEVSVRRREEIVLVVSEQVPAGRLKRLLLGAGSGGPIAAASVVLLALNPS